jgi:NADH:ubiquinone oxidoreductase subunit 6 (subunit J)
MLSAIVACAAIVCAGLAIRAARLMSSAIWLGGASAFTALWLALLGAPQLAVIELSVGAGLVTVLLVFAISISGEQAFTAHPRVPKALALVLALGALALLAIELAPASVLPRAANEIVTASPGDVFWNARALDVLVQMVLIFAGVLGILNLIGNPEMKAMEPARAHELRKTDGELIDAPMRQDKEKIQL